jgi:hypothetical protein
VFYFNKNWQVFIIFQWQQPSSSFYSILKRSQFFWLSSNGSFLLEPLVARPKNLTFIAQPEPDKIQELDKANIRPILKLV